MKKNEFFGDWKQMAKKNLRSSGWRGKTKNWPKQKRMVNASQFCVALFLANFSGFNQLLLNFNSVLFLLKSVIKQLNSSYPQNLSFSKSIFINRFA